MKRAPLLVLAGTAAGFVGVLSFHTRPAALTLPAERNRQEPGPDARGHAVGHAVGAWWARAPSAAPWARASSSATECWT